MFLNQSRIHARESVSAMEGLVKVMCIAAGPDRPACELLIASSVLCLRRTRVGDAFALKR